MAGEPRIRANYTKLALKQVKSLDASKRGRVREQIGALGDRVKEAGILEWLPAEVHVGVADACRRALGAREARALWRDLMLEAFERPLLSPLVRGALKLHGDRPTALARRIPQAWALVYRDCGLVQIDVGDEKGSADVRFTEMPHVVFDSDALLDSLAGDCDAILKYVGAEGSVERAIDDARAGAVTLQMRWETGGP